MLETNLGPISKNVHARLPDGIVHGKKNLKMLDITYRRNTGSDYTDQISTLQKNFVYAEHKDHNWLAPEFSLLYGSVLYEGASLAEKRALNHLGWVGFYNYTIGGEVTTMVYNELTCGALFHLGGYENLCRELDVETRQERYHVEAFKNIGHTAEMALLGEPVFERPLPHYLEGALVHPQGYAAPKQMLSNLRALLYTGFVGFSPFLATQYYALRGLRNLQLKVKEHQHAQYYEQLQNKEAFIPAPTAIAYFHYQDEAFHTATSQLICHELHKDFKKPTPLEKWTANLGVVTTQKTMNALSGTVPGIFSPDHQYIPLVYRLLQTPLFGMSPQDALNMTEQCFCQEHEGFHVAAKYHERALNDNRAYIKDLDYLSPANRELRIMSSASISQSLRDNRRAFKKFARSLDLSQKRAIATDAEPSYADN